MNDIIALPKSWMTGEDKRKNMVPKIKKCKITELEVKSLTGKKS